MYVPISTLPDSIRDALRKVGYGRKDIDVRIEADFEAPSAYGAGHRAQVMVVEVATGRLQHVLGSWDDEGGVPFGRGRSKLPKGFVALTSSMTGIWHLHVNPENAVALLPAKGEGVSPRELWILYGYKALTSAGRKSAYEYHGRGAEPSEDELRALSEMGYLKINKAGAAQITTEGKNVVENQAGKLREPPFAPRSRAKVTDEDLGLGRRP